VLQVFSEQGVNSDWYLWSTYMEFLYQKQGVSPPPCHPNPSDRFDRLRVNPSMQGLINAHIRTRIRGGGWKGERGRSLYHKKRGGALLEAG
jgi:hypothetical protein